MATNLVDAAKMAEKPKHKFIKKAALEKKKIPKKKLLADRLKSMYHKKDK